MEDIDTIKRIASMAGLKVQVQEEDGEVLIESFDSFYPRASFHWTSKQDFGDFIQELLAWQYDKGYDCAQRW